LPAIGTLESERCAARSRRHAQYDWGFTDLNRTTSQGRQSDDSEDTSLISVGEAAEKSRPRVDRAFGWHGPCRGRPRPIPYAIEGARLLGQGRGDGDDHGLPLPHALISPADPHLWDQ
jgi:hypothetical protein